MSTRDQTPNQTTETKGTRTVKPENIFAGMPIEALGIFGEQLRELVAEYQGFERRQSADGRPLHMGHALADVMVRQVLALVCEAAYDLEAAAYTKERESLRGLHQRAGGGVVAFFGKDDNERLPF